MKTEQFSELLVSIREMDHRQRSVFLMHLHISLMSLRLLNVSNPCLIQMANALFVVINTITDMELPMGYSVTDAFPARVLLMR